VIEFTKRSVGTLEVVLVHLLLPINRPVGTAFTGFIACEMKDFIRAQAKNLGKADYINIRSGCMNDNVIIKQHRSEMGKFLPIVKYD